MLASKLGHAGLYDRPAEFWRVGYHETPLVVSLEYQNGSGRFDDPQR
jgi:hypothetical protein